MIKLQAQQAISRSLGSQDSIFQHKKQDGATRFLQIRKNLPSEKRFHNPIWETRKEQSYLHIRVEQ